MIRWLRWLRLGRSVTGRAPLDVLFALAFVVFLGGVATIVWGVALLHSGRRRTMGPVTAVTATVNEFS